MHKSSQRGAEPQAIPFVTRENGPPCRCAVSGGCARADACARSYRPDRKGDGLASPEALELRARQLINGAFDSRLRLAFAGMCMLGLGLVSMLDISHGAGAAVSAAGLAAFKLRHLF